MGGGDKCLRALGGRTILDRVIERVRPQVDRVMINANGDPTRFARFGLPVRPDEIEGFAGPLAGVLTGMTWARREVPEATDVVTVPTDAPFVPRDLVARLVAARTAAQGDLAQAASDGQVHPVVGLWPVGLAENLRRALVEEGVRKVDVWTARHRLVTVAFPTTPVDPFFNANRPEDLAEAERLLGLIS